MEELIAAPVLTTFRADGESWTLLSQPDPSCPLMPTGLCRFQLLVVRQGGRGRADAGKRSGCSLDLLRLSSDSQPPAPLCPQVVRLRWSC